MAEREGFEPSKPVKTCRFSRPVHSTTLPPLLVEGVEDTSTATFLKGRRRIINLIELV
jgi:hypothetical protein